MTGEIKHSYQVLELEPSASLEQVKQAYREQVKVWHPDRFPNDVKMQRKAQERLKAINAAYEILCEHFGSENFNETQTASSGVHNRNDKPSKPERSTPPPSNGDENKGRRKKSKAKMILLIILTLGVLAYFSNLAIQYQAFANQLTAVKNIHIGDSSEEVKYRLGYPPYVLGAMEKNNFGGWDQPIFSVLGQENDPNKMPSSTKVEDYDEWMYNEPNNRLSIKFGKSGVVKSLNLYSDKQYGWGPIAGLYSGDSESKVLQLGTPSQQNLDGVSKIIEYRDIGVVVTLTKGNAYMITIQQPQSKAAIFWRFMHSHYGGN